MEIPPSFQEAGDGMLQVALSLEAAGGEAAPAPDTDAARVAALAMSFGS